MWLAALSARSMRTNSHPADRAERQRRDGADAVRSSRQRPAHSAATRDNRRQRRQNHERSRTAGAVGPADPCGERAERAGHIQARAARADRKPATDRVKGSLGPLMAHDETPTACTAAGRPDEACCSAGCNRRQEKQPPSTATAAEERASASAREKRKRGARPRAASALRYVERPAPFRPRSFVTVYPVRVRSLSSGRVATRTTMRRNRPSGAGVDRRVGERVLARQLLGDRTVDVLQLENLRAGRTPARRSPAPASASNTRTRRSSAAAPSRHAGRRLYCDCSAIG